LEVDEEIEEGTEFLIELDLIEKEFIDRTPIVLNDLDYWLKL
jgi:hypothetical protein